MINRAKMPRQLRDKGGIASVTPRKKYGLGSKLKERFRKLVPNELADIAVKAAPFVAPFNPGIAGLMRGIGRFDQRGSISDAFKQGVGTFAFGAGVRSLGGATDPFGGGLRGGFTSPLSPDRTTAVKEFFNPRKESTFDVLKEDETIADKIATEATEGTKKIAKDVGLGSIRDATGLFKDVPILKDLPSLVQQQILVGGVTSAATYIYQAFLADEPPQEEGETYDEYMARRKENVGRKMRSYFDNYFKFDKDYSAMTDEQKQAFIDRVNVKDGGRIGYQTGGVTMANTLAENIRRNLANQAAINQRLQQARARLDEIRPGRIASQSQLQQEANKIAAEDLNRMTGGARGVPAIANRAPTMSDIQAAISTMKAPPPSLPRDSLTGMLESEMLAQPAGMQNIEELDAIRNRVLAAQDAQERQFYLTDPVTGKQYKTEQEAIDDLGIVVYNQRFAEGGRAGLMNGAMPTGIMRTNKAGVMERDYRDKGGFVPVGIKEKADDVPAMLSKNEFVFTADAVRGAGNGSIEKGAQRMYDTMKKLEKRVV